MFLTYFHCKYYESNAGNSLASVRLSFRAREEEILEDEAGRGREERSCKIKTNQSQVHLKGK